MEVIKSNKGGSKLCYQGYMYTKHTTRKTVQWWKCVKRSSTACKGSITTSLQNENPTPGQPHNHDPSDISIKYTKSRYAMKEQAALTRDKPSQIFAQVVSTCEDDVQAMMPREENCKRTMRNQRPTPPVPQSFVDVTLPAEFTITTNHQQFLLYDNGQNAENRMLVFCSPDSLRRLAEAHTFFMDESTESEMSNHLFYFQYRDAYIYAAGNTTDEAGKFVSWHPKFLSFMKSLQKSVEEEPCGFIQRLFEDCDRPKLLANCRDMGWRTPLMLATLHARDDIVRYILLTEMCDINLQDCQGRTALHYSYMLDVDGKNIRKYLLHAEWIPKNKLPSDYEDIPNKDEWLDKEINYEELRRIIKGKKKGLQAFSKALKDCKYPVADFPIILSPLVQDYRDLIFLAVDYGKQDIAERLADLDADLKRKEKYIFRTEEQEHVEIYMTVIERAANLNLTELLSILQKIKEKRLLKKEAKVQKETATKIETNPNSRALIWT
ncbi:unnamed protein product [Mytilus edulis]|uniref:FLYWCH-type domain-containing protein n=1 Tax=Mytilus edulis TaxID=6550 RepID=A0A8S3RL10_MYTED|nr:unnamed protein product [Mytilus edulis]